jgi:hypothetical protein
MAETSLGVTRAFHTQGSILTVITALSHFEVSAEVCLPALMPSLVVRRTDDCGQASVILAVRTFKIGEIDHRCRAPTAWGRTNEEFHLHGD